jgi:hypothetical protein
MCAEEWTTMFEWLPIALLGVVLAAGFETWYAFR